MMRKKRTIKFIDNRLPVEETCENVDHSSPFGRDVAIFKKQWQSLKQGPLYKALGRPKTGTLIVDATFGLGKDSATFLALGLKVHAFERNKTIYELAKSSLDREPVDGIDLEFGDCRHSTVRNGILYFDPMYEHDRHKSKSNKGMELLKRLTELDPTDSDDFLAWALNQEFERIVVKRSNKARFLLDKKPICSFQTKAVRFDLYRSTKSI